MAAKPVFSPQQHLLIHEAAVRVYDEKFKNLKRVEGKPVKQEAMGLALGITQQTVSNLLKGTYRPGVQVARAIAALDGQTLEQLVGDFADPDKEDSAADVSAASGPFPNLSVCIQFHASTKHWSPWTIAAARAGFFGNSDFAPPEWAGKLDHLERALDRARKH